MTDFKQHSISSSVDSDFLVTEISHMSTEYRTESMFVHTESVEAEEETNFFAAEEKRLNSRRTNCEKRISILDDDVEDKPRAYDYDYSDEIFGSPRQKQSFDTKINSNEERKTLTVSKTKVINEGGNCDFSFSEELPTESMTTASIENLKKVGAKLLALAHREWNYNEIFKKWFSSWKEKVILYKTYEKVQVLETLIISKELKEKSSTESLQLEEVEANFKLLEDQEKNNMCRRIFIKMCECVEEMYQESFKVWRKNMINKRKYVRDELPKENGIKETKIEMRQGQGLSIEAEKKKIDILNKFFSLKNMIKHKYETTKMISMIKEFESIRKQGSQTLQKFDDIYKKPHLPNKKIFNDLLEKSLNTESSSIALEAKIKITQENINFYRDINKKHLFAMNLINSHESQLALNIKAEQNSRNFNTPAKEPISFISKKSTYYTSSHKNSNLSSIKKNIFSSNEKYSKSERITPLKLAYKTSDNAFYKEKSNFSILLTILSIWLFYIICSSSGTNIVI